jgi:hypothetical protein
MHYLAQAPKAAIVSHNAVLAKAHKLYLNTKSSDKDAIYRATIYQANKSYANLVTAIKNAKVADQALNEAVQAYMDDKQSQKLRNEFKNSKDANDIAWQAYLDSKAELDQ